MQQEVAECAVVAWVLCESATSGKLSACATNRAPQAEASDALARRAEAEARYAEALEALHSRQHASGMQVRGCCFGDGMARLWLL